MAQGGNETSYLEDTVSRPLIEAVAEVCEKRPTDPILYIANYLHQYKEQNRTSNLHLPSVTEPSHCNNKHIAGAALSALNSCINTKIDQPSPEHNTKHCIIARLQEEDEYDNSSEILALGYESLLGYETVTMSTITMVHKNMLCNLEDLCDDDDLT